ncbi:CHAD domain-containing protein [Rhodoferax sp. WC2427]|uniref:CYTH and CHAD domain-containing protein n=1 Tax=Rhodoferax sp. WC2427 TaxID=3234144 RepID=UPI00346666C1
MKSAALGQSPQEIELKLALPTSDPSSLARLLARVPILARRKPTRQTLHNVYYDTPEQILHQQRVALRIRRVGSEAAPRWLQTLKTGDRGHSALSQRGEWEVRVPSPTLAREALKSTPWAKIDPDDTVFPSLAPAFLTTFERTLWVVRRRDASVVEVALDIGHITAGEKDVSICELELELLAGPSTALFDIAHQIACTIAVLPLNKSKSERGYALAQNCLDAPLHAHPPTLTKNQSVPEAAACVLGEMFCQFTTNLMAVRSSDDPETVHQTRIGWRRFRSAVRLFKPAVAMDAVPAWQPLHMLLGLLGELRDLDVACTETLPALAQAYSAGDAQRADAWQAMAHTLQHAADLQRKSVRYALLEPAVGATLLATTQWLDGLAALPGPGGVPGEPTGSLRRWSRLRMARMHRQLKRARQDSGSPDSQHRVRILAKRMRYGVEALVHCLPQRRAKHWYRQATGLQLRLGAARDVVQAGLLAAKYEVDRGLVGFLQGVAVGRAMPSAGQALARKKEVRLKSHS